MSTVFATRRRGSRRRAAAALRALSATLVVASIASVATVASTPVPAQAATANPSAVTIAWTGESSPLAAFQPQRDPESPHYDDFKNLSISVSQTTGIVDQAVRVSVQGFAGTIASTSTALPIDNAKNFLQAMQCWGPDPLADDFRETCQWGGRYKEEYSSLGNSVFSDVAARTGPLDFSASDPTTHDVPFRTVGGTVVSGKSVFELVDGKEVETYPIRNYFGPSTTNEVTSARVNADGSGYFDFETQSADQAPQLGCGSEKAPRCWLVVVPRGTHFGGDGEQCSNILDPAVNFEPYRYGQRNAIQGGSPINDLCDYWDNRIAVPLDFAPTGATCEIGSAETRVIGSQLMIGAMSSWQPKLCQSLGTTFSFASNPDSVARAQLIAPDSTSSNFAYTGFPVSSGELQTDEERTALAASDLVYAPVGVSAATIAFFAESPSGRQEKLVISPRLMAKLLTQSYPFTVPQSQGDPSKNAIHLGTQNRKYTRLSDDPEFRQLNPNYAQFPYSPAIVLPGPSGADAIRQVWRWIFADRDAISFLLGVKDPWGMTVNPYYLPKGDPYATVPWYLSLEGQYIDPPETREVGLSNLDGSPQRLFDTPLDSFPKNDETLMPLELQRETSRFDSIQFAPYAETFLQAARRTFRADPASKTIWNPDAINVDGTKGTWVSGGSQVPGQRFMITVTDTVSAGRWGLSSATLLGANSTAEVVPTTATMTAALSAIEATSLDTVGQINPAKVPASAYPLTIITYAGVNLDKTTSDQRLTLASMLSYVTIDGQRPGTSPGMLPDGYVPLTGELTQQAILAVQQIMQYVPPAAPGTNPPPKSTGTGTIAQDSYETGSTTPSATGGAGPSVTSGADSLNENRTAASDTSPIARSGLVIALVAGLVGLIVAPVLFRGRGLFR